MKGMCAAPENISPLSASALAGQPLNIRRNSSIGRRRGTAVVLPHIELGGSSRSSAEARRMRPPADFTTNSLPNASFFTLEQQGLLQALLLITTSLKALLSSATIWAVDYTIAMLTRASPTASQRAPLRRRAQGRRARSC
jgi:hypothetical protein